MTQYVCPSCQHRYDPAEGDLKQGVMPGTPWSALPEDWTCPDCHAPKFEFTQWNSGGGDGSGWVIR